MATGTTTVDFGSGGSLEASATVTGQGAITTNSLVEAWARPVDVSTTLAGETYAEEFHVVADGIVAATGFTITVRPRHGKAFGQHTIAWVWA